MKQNLIQLRMKKKSFSSENEIAFKLQGAWYIDRKMRFMYFEKDAYYRGSFLYQFRNWLIVYKLFHILKPNLS